MITISDIEAVKDDLIDIFPDAVRGSVAKSNWGSGKRQLHLAFFIGSDTVSGYMVEPCRGMYQFKAWDTNSGVEWMYCNQDRYDFVDFIRNYFTGQDLSIARTVCDPGK